MGILSVTENPEGWSGGQNDNGDVEIGRQFFVLTDTLNAGPLEVLSAQDPNTALQVPPYGTDYHAGSDTMITCWVRAKQCKRDRDQPRLWYVDVKYSSSIETQSNNSNDENEIEIEWGTSKYQKVIEKDVNGSNILASNGEPFLPRVEVDDFRPILTVRRSLSTYNYAFWYSYVNAVNSDEFAGADVGQAKVSDISAVRRYRNAVSSWRQTIQIEFAVTNIHGWNIRRLDEGTFYFNGGANKTTFKDVNGQTLQSGLLDGSGGLGSAGSPVYREFFGYPFKPFAALGINI